MIFIINMIFIIKVLLICFVLLAVFLSQKLKRTKARSDLMFHFTMQKDYLDFLVNVNLFFFVQSNKFVTGETTRTFETERKLKFRGI